MRYYFVNLAVHFGIALFFAILVVVCVGRNNKRRTKHASTFLLPVVFAILFLLQMVRFVVPRIFDINDILNENYQTQVGELQSVSYLENTVVVDGMTYYISPRVSLPDIGSQVKVRYTKSGKYAIHLDRIDTSFTPEEPLEQVVYTETTSTVS